MASSAKLVFFLVLALSIQINAREFFSKFSSVNNNAKETTVANNDQQQETTVVPNKQNEQFVTKEEQEPTFLPQTQTQSGYGLYGHESGQFPSDATATPTATTTNKVTYAPYVTPIRSGSFENYNPNTNPDNKYETQAQQNTAGARFSQNNNNNNGYRTTVATNEDRYYNSNGYNNNVERQGMSDTRYNQNLGDARFAENTNRNNNGYRTTVATNDARFADNTNSNNNGYRTTVATNDNSYSNSNGYQNNAERQGMSDTRFMENGKYFYDVKSENNYFQNRQSQFQNQNARVPLRNQNTYATQGAGYYGTNVANSDNQMNGERYENNQEDFEEEFEP